MTSLTKLNLSKLSWLSRRLKFVVLLLFCLVFVLSCRQNKPGINVRYIKVKNSDGRIPLSESSSYVSVENGNGRFPLSVSGQSAPLYISSKDFPAVIRALKDLQADIGCVTNTEPKLYIDNIPQSKEIILVGTLGKNPIIDSLVQNKKLDVTGIIGHWETFLLQVVEKPLPGVDRALIITGNDKRGTIYGIYDLSAQIGVSPWYWWADVPVVQHNNLFVLPGPHTLGEPAVKYRGIFINHEWPSLGKWSINKFGSQFNHFFYEKVFELMLRLKANYLWPAMWNGSFRDDDPLNPKLADEYGIIMGTSHHEPMMRAYREWGLYGKGKWNYTKNETNLKNFWKQGISNTASYENIITVGMRGNGDTVMDEGVNIALLKKIIDDQRNILAKVTGKYPSAIPQVWGLYKEVQDFYDKGMRVPDDITLLFCDDNNGNIMRLPTKEDKPRPGGYGMYYHFVFLGDPRSYKWVNTVPVSKIWEQMHLTYSYGVKQIWIANAGGIKPVELPIEFFLDYAWNPDKWPVERLSEYTRLWAEKKFGREHAATIADIVSKYTKYNGRRKPELMTPDIYSLTNYREAETIVADYNKIADKAEQIYKVLPSEYKDAYYQLVLYPVKACANLTELYVTLGKNYMYAQQGRAITNELAAKARNLFKKDTKLSRYYNKTMSGGKWNHMMDQTHISFKTWAWRDPEKDIMPEVKKIRIPHAADMLVSIEGENRCWWPEEKHKAILPEFNPYQKQAYYFEIFNRGKKPFNYTIQSGAPWLMISSENGIIEKEERLLVSVDWRQTPTGIQRDSIIITGPYEDKVIIHTIINNPAFPRPDQVNGFVEGNGYVSIEAEHYTRAIDALPIKWQRIPDLGRTLSAMTPFPVTVQSQLPGGNSPRLEYNMYLFKSGEVKVRTYLSPTINFKNTEGLRYGISFDDEPPQIVIMRTTHIIRVSDNDSLYVAWQQSVRNNITAMVSRHNLKRPGDHVLKYWMVDPGVVLQKLVVETDSVKPSYLGPPESFYRAVKEETSK